MARRRPKLPPFVLLSWLEHYSVQPKKKATYQTLRRLDKDDLAEPLYTCGWLVKADKTHYYVATTIAFDKGKLEFTEVMAILKGSVTKKVQERLVP